MPQGRAVASFTRPADTTAYGAGDLVANSTTAGSVVPMDFKFVGPSVGGWLSSVQMTHSTATVANSTFRLWLMSALPTVTNGDNGALAGITAANVIGTVALTVDQAAGFAHGLTLVARGVWIPPRCWGLLQATAAYAPGNAEVFRLALMFDTP